ncbi:MAG: RecX family transcriptional regulator [Aerococcaceae bacterium]|nr:RecX family transcriptional regulator [Aerococcaceae bacterium]
MQITKIERQKKHPERYSIFIDGAFAFGVHENTLIQYNLYRQQPIDAETIANIQETELTQRVYGKAVHYLSYGLRTVHEVRTHLLTLLKEIEELAADEERLEQAVDETIAKLLEQRYLDDAFYAEAFTRDAANITRKGPNVIRQELLKKGLSDAMILYGLDEYSDAQQWENAQFLAEKFIKTKAKLPPKMQTMKLKHYLLTKGYDAILAEKAVRTCLEEPDEDLQEQQLALEAHKIFKRRRAKYQGQQLLYKVKEGLYQKGYDLQVIQNWLDDHENELLEDN